MAPATITAGRGLGACGPRLGKSLVDTLTSYRRGDTTALGMQDARCWAAVHRADRDRSPEGRVSASEGHGGRKQPLSLGLLRKSRCCDPSAVWPTDYVVTHWPQRTRYLTASRLRFFASATVQSVLAHAQAGRRPTRGRSGPKRARSLAGRFSAVLRSVHGAVCPWCGLPLRPSRHCNLGGRP